MKGHVLPGLFLIYVSFEAYIIFFSELKRVLPSSCCLWEQWKENRKIPFPFTKSRIVNVKRGYHVESELAFPLCNAHAL